ncbi:MAG: hypothetical protein NZM25_10885 [Leptospiraceae bacterium]|nr:hypothetical protein [Leptospiraceae bacterium]
MAMDKSGKRGRGFFLLWLKLFLYIQGFVIEAKELCISFSEVKEYLLATSREKVGAVGKILRRDGSLYGYQIIRLPRDSLFYKLGARKGDIILSIKTDKEIPLDSPWKLYSLLMRLDQEKAVSVRYERKGKKYEKIFRNQSAKIVTKTTSQA